ncbi:MAG: helix-turn-helix transcriptional regulator [Dehalococcoidia bacterium]
MEGADVADPKSRSAGLDQDFRRQLGRNLRRARLDAGRTLEEVAAHFGLNTNMVWRWEAGRSAPMIDRLVQIAVFYGVSPDALLARPHDIALPAGFLAAMEQAASGLAPDDLDLILDFAHLVRGRRRQATGPAALPWAAEQSARYGADRPSDGEAEQAP